MEPTSFECVVGTVFILVLLVPIIKFLVAEGCERGRKTKSKIKNMFVPAAEWNEKNHYYG